MGGRLCAPTNAGTPKLPATSQVSKAEHGNETGARAVVDAVTAEETHILLRQLAGSTRPFCACTFKYLGIVSTDVFHSQNSSRLLDSKPMCNRSCS